MMRGWPWVLGASFLACNADQFVGVDGSVPDSGGSDVIVSGGDAGDAAVEASCGDTQTDPSNCGTCGRSCGGGACSGGVCQPADFADMSKPIEALAVDDTNVYIGADVIWACDRGGCNKNPTPISSSVAPSGNRNILGITPFSRNSASWLLYTNYGDSTGGTNGYVGACPVSDCLSDAGHLFDFPKASSTSVWSNQTGFIGGLTLVKQLTLDGGSPSPFNLATMAAPVLSIATDAAGNLAIGTGAGVFACSIPGNTCGAPTLLSTAATAALSVALRNNVVYWTNATNQSVESCPLGGCNNNPTVLMTPGGTLGDVIVNASGRLFVSVNFTGGTPTDNTGSIYSCDVANCNPGGLAHSRHFPWHLAQINQVLFWSEGLEVASPMTAVTPYQVIRLSI